MPMNPFHTLYLTEGVGEFDFPSLFSPVLVPFVEPLFSPSNVLLKGMQGTGKSMLLSLLDSKVRLAFWDNDRKAIPTNLPQGDPLNPALRKFVGASINLSNSKALKLSELTISKDHAENSQLTGAYFSDFVNCTVLRDLLGSLHLLVTQLSQHQDDRHLAEIGLCGDLERLEAAARKITQHPTGEFLAECESIDAMRAALERRLQAYRRRINSPRNQLPEMIDRTRSLLGEPLEAAAEIFRDEGVIARDTQVYVTIDQFETLSRKAEGALEDERQRVKRFISEIEELISNRVRAVYYRIGTRPTSILEHCDAARDYMELDLDRVLQRTEHSRRKPLFHRFVEDAFRRRLSSSELAECVQTIDSAAPLKQVFGETPTLSKQGEDNAPKDRNRVVKCEDDWPAGVGEYLVQLAQTDPVAARLGEAWVRQQVARTSKQRKKSSNDIEETQKELLDLAEWERSGSPWMTDEKKWWRKERLAVTVLQIAASNAQRVPYHGEFAIVQLSGENVLSFICICREIWECNERYRRLDTAMSAKPQLFPFHKDRQSEGVREASRIWHDKIRSSPVGNTLLRFMDLLGKKLHEQLIQDRQMSYPGANGISLTRQDYTADPEIKRLLDDATAECYLLQRRHTPKTLGRGESVKWYPHPILAPYYEITVTHTKEPRYLSITTLRSWLEEGKVLRPRNPAASQQPLDVPIVSESSEKKPDKISTTSHRQRTLSYDDSHSDEGE